MFSFLTRSGSTPAIPDAIYGALVANARNHVFFSEFAVPDTVMGRFDVLTMHVYLFSRRMKQEETQIATELGQEVFDCFVADVERALRELGIGDTTVPKRKKKMIRSFYGQIEDFDAALNDADVVLLAEKIALRFFETDEVKPGASAIADYMIQVDSELNNQAFDTIGKGEIRLPDPEIQVSA